jgi:hypothetical protein
VKITPRKKPPFFCRAKRPDGSFVHVDRPLKDGEGKLCAPCQKEADSAQDRFFNTPIKPAPNREELERPSGRNGPMWPLNDDGSICSP